MKDFIDHLSKETLESILEDLTEHEGEEGVPEAFIERLNDMILQLEEWEEEAQKDKEEA